MPHTVDAARSWRGVPPAPWPAPQAPALPRDAHHNMHVRRWQPLPDNIPVLYTQPQAYVYCSDCIYERGVRLVRARLGAAGQGARAQFAPGLDHVCLSSPFPPCLLFHALRSGHPVQRDIPGGPHSLLASRCHLVGRQLHPPLLRQPSCGCSTRSTYCTAPRAPHSHQQSRVLPGFTRLQPRPPPGPIPSDGPLALVLPSLHVSSSLSRAAVTVSHICSGE
jgi:hypothetical protein